jgi:hypothetical protein
MSKRESQGVLPAHGRTLGAGLLVEAVSHFLPGSGQVGYPQTQGGSAAGDVGEPVWRQGGFDHAGEDGGGPCLPPVGEDIDRDIEAPGEEGTLVISKGLVEGVLEPDSRAVGVA